YSKLAPNSPAYTQVTDAFQQENPFERASRELVKVEINSVLPLSESTWQVEWLETVSDRSGNHLSGALYRATLNTQTQQPQNKTQMQQNPLGLWITTFNDVRLN
uniref:type IV secretion system protein n=2 Tax=uncultured Vibrio sp. TaxID=114054 RepID=UPI00261F6537